MYFSLEELQIFFFCICGSSRWVWGKQWRFKYAHRVLNTSYVPKTHQNLWFLQTEVALLRTSATRKAYIKQWPRKGGGHQIGRKKWNLRRYQKNLNNSQYASIPLMYANVPGTLLNPWLKSVWPIIYWNNGLSRYLNVFAHRILHFG